MNKDMKKIKNFYGELKIKYLKYMEAILDFLREDDDIIEDYKRNNSKYFTRRRRYM